MADAIFAEGLVKHYGEVRLPGFLQPIADWNPMSNISLALRDLWGNAPVGVERGAGLPADHPLPLALAWIAAILLVFVPLSIAKYRKAASR